MKKILSGVGWFLSLTSGLLIFFFWFIAMTHWLGIIGSILAIFIAPCLIIFPIIFWIVEGVFPVMYFVIWAVGFSGIIICATTSED